MIDYKISTIIENELWSNHYSYDKYYSIEFIDVLNVFVSIQMYINFNDRSSFQSLSHSPLLHGADLLSSSFQNNGPIPMSSHNQCIVSKKPMWISHLTLDTRKL